MQTFDDFTFAGGSSIRQVAWQGIYCVPQNNSATPAPTASAFVVSFYPDQAGRPNVGAPIGSITLPVAQVNQTSNGAFGNATCDGAAGTSWALYSYSAVLPASLPAAAGTRYWFSVQAVTPSASVAWGWRQGTLDNRSSITIKGAQVFLSTIDRAFALTP